MQALQRLYTGSDGKPSSSKIQNSLAFGLIFVKLALSGSTLFGHDFQEITLDSMGPYLALLGVTMTGYVARSNKKDGQHIIMESKQ